MKNPWIAAILNFFFMGPGTIYNGRRKLFGLGLTIGALGFGERGKGVLVAFAGLCNHVGGVSCFFHTESVSRMETGVKLFQAVLLQRWSSI